MTAGNFIIDVFCRLNIIIGHTAGNGLNNSLKITPLLPFTLSQL